MKPLRFHTTGVTHGCTTRGQTFDRPRYETQEIRLLEVCLNIFFFTSSPVNRRPQNLGCDNVTVDFKQKTQKNPERVPGDLRSGFWHPMM